MQDLQSKGVTRGPQGSRGWHWRALRAAFFFIFQINGKTCLLSSLIQLLNQIAGTGSLHYRGCLLSYQLGYRHLRENKLVWWSYGKTRKDWGSQLGLSYSETLIFQGRRTRHNSPIIVMAPTLSWRNRFTSSWKVWKSQSVIVFVVVIVFFLLLLSTIFSLLFFFLNL